MSFDLFCWSDGYTTHWQQNGIEDGRRDPVYVRQPIQALFKRKKSNSNRAWEFEIEIASYDLGERRLCPLCVLREKLCEWSPAIDRRG